jgi:hypothetical protein
LNIAQWGLRRLRAAIQKNEVSFPSQVPKFECQSRADLQWRLAELYFIHNWSCPDLGRRCGVTMERARQLIFNWVQRASVLGYLQEIPTTESSLKLAVPKEALLAEDETTLPIIAFTNGSPGTMPSEPAISLHATN